MSTHPPLLIGLDPEHHAEDVLRLGLLLTSIVAAPPLVVSVAEWPRLAAWTSEMQRSLDESLAEPFARARERLEEPVAETRALHGDSVAGALERLAESEQAAAIVIGSSHRGPIGRLLAGSVGASLMQAAPCAVAVAPAGYGRAAAPGPARRIAVAFDGTEEAWVALRTGSRIAARSHASLTIVAVSDPPQAGYTTALEVLLGEGLVDHDRQRKEALVEAALASLPEGLRGSAILLSGKAGAELVAASADFDLMFAGSRSYGPLRRALLGSTTRALAGSAHCPLVILPRGSGDDPLAVGAPSGG